MPANGPLGPRLSSSAYGRDSPECCCHGAGNGSVALRTLARVRRGGRPAGWLRSGRVGATDRAGLTPEVYVYPAGKHFPAAHDEMLALLHPGGQPGPRQFGPLGAEWRGQRPPEPMSKMVQVRSEPLIPYQIGRFSAQAEGLAHPDETTGSCGSERHSPLDVISEPPRPRVLPRWNCSWSGAGRRALAVRTLGDRRPARAWSASLNSPVHTGIDCRDDAEPVVGAGYRSHSRHPPSRATVGE